MDTDSKSEGDGQDRMTPPPSSDNVGMPPWGPNTSVEDLVARLEHFQALREAFQRWVYRYMRKGVHYTVYKRSSRDSPIDYKPRDGLLESGAEEFLLLYNYEPTYEMADDVRERLNNPENVLFVRCNIIEKGTGVVMGTAVGAYPMDTRNPSSPGPHHRASHQAYKRAMVAGTITACGLSSIFGDAEYGESLAAEAPERDTEQPNVPPRSERDKTASPVKAHEKTPKPKPATAQELAEQAVIQKLMSLRNRWIKLNPEGKDDKVGWLTWCESALRITPRDKINLKLPSSWSSSRIRMIQEALEQIEPRAKEMANG